ncbi:RidA family protein [Limnoraphis robusta]|jgi:enamine deaminase RidA (YjgF/YER057c/UK114 family)|uniref:RidA family protein n=1 Tax=Limnoraphis robusta TaxID=1118279 RepID=UPI002B220622|nr:RidA family protein [Limnoraphis robusta]MEA5498593.1 RidA family protein [Limnoraphis robusta BA-68 BA1]
MDRSLVVRRSFSGAPWESQVGYCRAVRVANQIFVTGTAPVTLDGSIFAPGDAYAQAKRCFEIIQQALQALDADLSCIVRTRMFVTDISRWAEFGQAHHESFADHPPATTMVEVQRLIDPAMLIEIEADAIVVTQSE